METSAVHWSKHQINEKINTSLSAIRQINSSRHFFILYLSTSSCCRGTDSLSEGRVPLWSYIGGNDKAAIIYKKKSIILPSTGRGEMNQRERGGRAEVVDRGLFEGCCGSWQEQLEQHQNCSISRHPIPSAYPQVWRGQREILPIIESEVSTPPTIVNGATSEWLHPSSPSHSTSRIHYSVVCIWLGVYRLVLSPGSPLPTPLNCTPGGVYGEADRMFGPPGDQSLLFK